jgi:hypothetical protein
LTLPLELVAIPDPGPEHTTVDRKHAIAVLEPSSEHVVIDRKHAITILNPNPEHVAVDLKPAVVDLAAVTTLSVSPVRPHPIVNACEWLGFGCECL